MMKLPNVMRNFSQRACIGAIVFIFGAKVVSFFKMQATRYYSITEVQYYIISEAITAKKVRPKFLLYIYIIYILYIYNNI